MKDSLERPSAHNLEDYLNYLDQVATQDLSMKVQTVEWLQNCGKNLAEMTTGKEKKELLRVVKEVGRTWNEIWELIEQRKSRANNLLQVFINSLFISSNHPYYSHAYNFF